MQSQGVPPELRPLPFTTKVSELTGPVLIEFAHGDDAEVAVLTVANVHGGAGSVRVVRNDSLNMTVLRRVPLVRDLGDVAMAALRAKPVRAYSLPSGTTIGGFDARAALTRTGYWAVALMIAVAVWLLPSFGIMARLPAVLASVMVMVVAGFAARHARPLTRTTSQTFRTADGAWALSDLVVPRPALPDGSATERVDGVKAEYGRLLSDLVYRIENPALFDAAVGPTSDFTSALIQWDASGDDIGAVERAELAARIELTFATARANAETIGLRHLPGDAREPGERAAKAARLATAATTPGERSAALRQATKILESLALYYLPRPVEALELVEGRPVRALPGRRRPVT